MLEVGFKNRIVELETEVSELKALVNRLIAENIFLRQENTSLKERVKFLE